MSKVPVPPKHEQATLDRSALSGVAWSGASKWTTQLLSWTSTILVARILLPSDFGLLTMAAVFMGAVAMLSEFGVGTAVITLREMPAEEVRQVNGLSVLLGLGGTLLTAAMCYPLGVFFRAPELPPVLLATGLTFLIASFQTVPAALLRRERDFRTLAIIDVTRGVVMPLVTLAGALLGLRYWALVLGTITGAVVTTAMTLRYRREPFARPRPDALSHVLHFSRHILVSRLAWVVYQDGDFAVAGRRLGQVAVGNYSLAWTIASSPIEKVTMVLSDVTPTLFSAVQHDQPALRRYFLNLSEIVCLATFPAAVGLALVSQDLVAVLLGPKWSGAAGPMALLALYAGARSVTGLFGHLFAAARETTYLMWSSLVLAALLLVGFYIGSFWGGTGIAAAWLVVHPSFSVVVFARVRRVLDLGPSEYLRALRLGLDGTVAMATVLVGFQLLVAPAWGAPVRLIVSVVLGASTYGLSTWLLHRARLLQIVNWIRRARGGEALAS
jgi:O-antigen/teichoic acid export membrane protein